MIHENRRKTDRKPSETGGLQKIKDRKGLGKARARSAVRRPAETSEIRLERIRITRSAAHKAAETLEQRQEISS